ncbi:MAG: hypothetical protein ACRD0J_17335, partial [Acidimicrobiales bacterium]
MEEAAVVAGADPDAGADPEGGAVVEGGADPEGGVLGAPVQLARSREAATAAAPTTGAVLIAVLALLASRRPANSPARQLAGSLCSP